MGDYDALYKVLADSDNMQHYPYVFDERRVRDWIERNMERYSKEGTLRIITETRLSIRWLHLLEWIMCMP